MNSGDSMCAARCLRFASDQAGATLRNTPGPSPTPYQPTPKPSPLVGSAPSRECRLWSMIPCWVLKSSSSRTSGCPNQAIQRHMGSDHLVEAAHLERPHDVGDALHQRPDPGKHDQRVRLVDEELTARVEGHDRHQDPGGQAEPPGRIAVLEDEGADDPPDADHQEQEPEDVGESREGLL